MQAEDINSRGELRTTNNRGFLLAESQSRHAHALGINRSDHRADNRSATIQCKH